MTTKDILHYHKEFKVFLQNRNQWNRFKILLFLMYGIKNHSKKCEKDIIQPYAFIAAFPAVLLHRSRKGKTNFLKLNLEWQTHYYKLD